MTRLLALAAAALSISSVAATAAPDLDQPTMKVQYGDLNLATTSGVATFYSRIKAASVAACASVGDDRTLGGLNQERACRAEMISKAVQNAKNPALTEVATGQSATRQVASH